MENLEVLFIPIGQRAIIVPKSLIEYILPYAPPLPSEYAHPTLVGSLIYKNRKVPVMDLAKLDDEKPPSAKKHPSGEKNNFRLIIVSSVSEASPFLSYALIATAPPRIFNIAANTVEELDEPHSDLFYSKIKFGSELSYQYAYVPALDNIESSILATH